MTGTQKLIGTRLGSATLTQLVGSGGMGMVYLAHQEHLDRDVAIKVLRSATVMISEQNEEFLERFRREAHVIAQLDHVNILPIYEYGEQDGLAYLVMPYLAGGSLHERLLKYAPLSFHEVLLYTEQAAAALSYAHAHKIVHRDIKPRNMLFHADGRLVLVDFGIAHILRDDREKSTGQTLTGSGHFIGSVDYMAPEMVRGKPVDSRTDIYEFGVVLFQMLTGRLPFSGATSFIVAAQHLHEPVPSLLAFNPALPASIDAVVHKAMAKDPGERYQSIAELTRALRVAISSAGTLVERDQRFFLPKLSASRPASFVSSPPLGDVTQEISTSEMPTLQQQLSTATAPETGLDRHTSLLRQDATTRNIAPVVNLEETYVMPPERPLMQHQIQSSLPLPQRAEHRGKNRWRWIGLVALVLCLCGVVFTAGIFFAPAFMRQMHVPFMAPSSVRPVPGGAGSSPPIPGSFSSPDQQARRTVQRYYDAINQRHYANAYSLWGQSYQSSSSYSQFSQGFGTTQHDDVVFQMARQLNDGTVQVSLILYATNKYNAGSIVRVYQGSYIVGQENGAWKLISSSLLLVTAPRSATPSHRSSSPGY